MAAASPEDPRTLWLLDGSPPTERPLENVQLGTPSRQDTREIDEVERLRRENRILKDRINYLGIDKSSMARCLYLILGLPYHVQAPEADVIKVRVIVRTRVDDQTVIDGCQWRKYGEKDAKENAYPRTYYRCIMSSECPIRKKEQRCAGDGSILSTTYKKEHNHPLPLEARSFFSLITSGSKMFVSGSELTLDMIQKDIASLFSSGTAFISASDHRKTLILDMTKPSSSCNDVPQRNLQVIQTDPQMMAPEVDERSISALLFQYDGVVITAVK